MDSRRVTEGGGLVNLRLHLRFVFRRFVGDRSVIRYAVADNGDDEQDNEKIQPRAAPLAVKSDDDIIAESVIARRLMVSGDGMCA